MSPAEAFQELVNEGCDKHKLRAILDVAASLPRDCSRARLKTLAADAAALADRINSVLEESLEATAGLLSGAPTWTAHWKLPQTLRAFAEHLRILAAQKERRLDAPRDMQWAAISAYVELATGKVHDRLVAAVVSPHGYEFGEEQLKTFRARNRSLMNRLRARAIKG